MSRIGKKPVEIPSGVQVAIKDLTVSVQGPKGKLQMEVHPRMKVAVKDGHVEVSRPTDINSDRALHGLTRSLLQNMVRGVVDGYKKELEIVGVGYKAEVKGKKLVMALGFTHPIEHDIPEGIVVHCPNPTRVAVSGLDKQMVGQLAADIRSSHKPEPYKGKGIHYVGEVIRRKQGKTVG
ncbi:MAG: 50S ribosomal protein L6 [Candidatus Omnitrophica bacterium]|nr:50S ribosomal protein L6 [Candidatus Omnitrophota bacterium]